MKITKFDARVSKVGPSGVSKRDAGESRHGYRPAKKARDILSDLDLMLLTDLYCPTDCTPCQEEVDHTGIPCLYIGWPQELGAGIRGGMSDVAPMFFDAPTAFSWIVANEAELRKEFPGDDD